MQLLRINVTKHDKGWESMLSRDAPHIHAAPPAGVSEQELGPIWAVCGSSKVELWGWYQTLVCVPEDTRVVAARIGSDSLYGAVVVSKEQSWEAL